MRKLYFLVLSFLPLLSLGQSNYKAGRVVTLKGDTLHGYIDYKDWGHNPKNISFKTTLSDKAQQLTAGDINDFGIDGYVNYQAYKVTISLNPVDISSPASLLDTAKATDTVFLKILQTGKNITLYAYRDNLKERFYIKDASMEEPAELIYGIYQDPNSNGAVYKNIYQNQLSFLAAKYSSKPDKLNSHIQRSAYREEDLTPIVVEINDGQVTKIASKSSDNPKFRLFAGAAFTSNTVKYSDKGPFYGAQPSTSSAPKIAVGLDVFANPDIGNLIFRLEFGYEMNNFNFVGKPNPITNAADPITNSLKLKQRLILITPQVIYNIYNADNLKVFVDVGYTVHIVKYPSEELFTYQDNKVIVTTKLTADPVFRDTYSTFQFKAGVVLSKKFEIYGAYCPGAEITNVTTYEADQSSLQIGVNYYFGRAAK